MTAAKTRKKVSAAEQARRDAARTAKLEAAHDTLAAGVEALTTSEDWTGWLAVAARFHKYSFGNQILIMRQRPDATLVAGYRRWQELGYQVRSGEKGIAILRPNTRRISAEEAKEADQPETEGQSRVRGWAIATVHDISQCDPIEGKAVDLSGAGVTRTSELVGESPEGLQERLVELITAAGYTFGPDLSGGTRKGATSAELKSVVVKPDMSAAQTVKTTAHELAHLRFGHTESNPVTETEAESVAYLVCSALGLDTAGYSFTYVAGWASGADAVRATGKRVTELARQILADIEPAELDETETAETRELVSV